VRNAAVIAALVLLAGCAGTAAHRGGKLSPEQYLSAIQTVPAPMRNGSSGAPLVGLMISGTITNDGTTPLQCTRASFVLVRSGDGDVSPTAEFCALPSIAPQQSTFFNATFAAAPRDDWKLRFEHSDGTYEIHDLIVPPG
jgi:hypothetical protein